MKSVEIKCRVCGELSPHNVLTSTNSFGSPDLDLRPPQMRRGTMPYWVQKCPYCGYVATSIKEGTRATRDYLKTDNYRNAGGRSFRSALAQKFYQQYLICILDGKTEDAFYAALHAAWACDDSQDRENAVYCRNLALEKIGRLLEAKRDNETFTLLKCDLLRRAGRFEELIAEYSDVKMKDKLLNKLLAFQLDRARAEDTARYTVHEAAYEGNEEGADDDDDDDDE